MDSPIELELEGDVRQAFLASRTPLADKAACSLYVAATRARSSVALVAERPDRLGLPIWTPADTD